MPRLTFLLLLSILSIHYPAAQPVVSSTLSAERKKTQQTADSLFLNMNYKDARSLRLGFWAIVAYNRWSPLEQKFIVELMNHPEKLSVINQYKLTAIVAHRKPEEWEPFLFKMMKKGDDKLAVLAYHALCEAGKTPPEPPLIKNQNWEAILNDLNNSVHRQALRNESIEIIKEHIRSRYPDSFHIIVATSPDRAQPARLYLLLPTDDGHAVYGPYTYLLSSMYHVSSYFTYGDTPCGVYKIFNREYSKNEFIGPTETLWTGLPFELSPARWGSKDKQWSAELYRDFLPESLQESPLMWQAYRAGAVGRYDIILHGSTIDPDNFVHTPYHPLTPSLGCLSALELWDGETGRRLVSHQQDLMEMIPQFEDIAPGFMYVITTAP